MGKEDDETGFGVMKAMGVEFMRLQGADSHGSVRPEKSQLKKGETVPAIGKRFVRG